MRLFLLACLLTSTQFLLGQNYQCQFDVNSDFFIGVEDLNNVLSQYGTENESDADFNGDNIVNVADLLSILSIYGAEIPEPSIDYSTYHDGINMSTVVFLNNEADYTHTELYINGELYANDTTIVTLSNIEDVAVLEYKVWIADGCSRTSQPVQILNEGISLESYDLTIDLPNTELGDDLHAVSLNEVVTESSEGNFSIDVAHSHEVIMLVQESTGSVLAMYNSNLHGFSNAIGIESSVWSLLFNYAPLNQAFNEDQEAIYQTISNFPEYAELFSEMSNEILSNSEIDFSNPLLSQLCVSIWTQFEASEDSPSMQQLSNQSSCNTPLPPAYLEALGEQVYWNNGGLHTSWGSEFIYHPLGIEIPYDVNSPLGAFFLGEDVPEFTELLLTLVSSISPQELALGNPTSAFLCRNDGTLPASWMNYQGELEIILSTGGNPPLDRTSDELGGYINNLVLKMHILNLIVSLLPAPEQLVACAGWSASREELTTILQDHQWRNASEWTVEDLSTALGNWLIEFSSQVIPCICGQDNPNPYICFISETFQFISNTLTALVNIGPIASMTVEGVNPVLLDNRVIGFELSKMGYAWYGKIEIDRGESPEIACFGEPEMDLEIEPSFQFKSYAYSFRSGNNYFVYHQQDWCRQDLNSIFNAFDPTYNSIKVERIIDGNTESITIPSLNNWPEITLDDWEIVEAESQELRISIEPDNLENVRHRFLGTDDEGYFRFIHDSDMCSSPCQGLETLTDPRDGYSYPLIEIQGRCWTQVDMTYDTGDGNTHKPQNIAYYNTPAIISGNVCPSGWHVATDEDWIAAEIAAGMPESEANLFTFRGEEENIREVLMLGGESGLDATYSGIYHAVGSPVEFEHINASNRYFPWTSTLENDALIRRFFRPDNDGVRRQVFNGGEDWYLPARCVKDSEEPED